MLLSWLDFPYCYVFICLQGIHLWGFQLETSLMHWLGAASGRINSKPIKPLFTNLHSGIYELSKLRLDISSSHTSALWSTTWADSSSMFHVRDVLAGEDPAPLLELPLY